ncbi:type II and III secretion system protein family protein [Variovorax sp. HW608]|uniref:type II and III secretion system protein family protein n=1 Tax=Variovorax sp. HW608 TaxID=1034889 RepID=UPI000B5AF7A2|nr:type II and III secretion system protein family protein [Variovorax sp. HW608]
MFRSSKTAIAFAACALLMTGPGAVGQTMPVQGSAVAASATAPAMASAQFSEHKRCSRVEVDTPATVTLGKSTVIPLKSRVTRILVSGQPPSPRPVAMPANGYAPTPGMPMGAPPMQANAQDGVAEMEVMLLSPTDLFFRGKRAGSMNVIMQNAEGVCFIKDIVVTVDPGALQAKLAELMPGENRIKVRGAENSLVLSGEVSDPGKLDEVMTLAASYGDAKKVVNMLRTAAPQQVMLEVKIAEVSKTLLDKLGASLALTKSYSGGMNTYTLLSNFLSGGAGLIEALRVGRAQLQLDGQKDDGIVRVLAEPNVMAISGQQASFLSGGKIFIPVSQSATGTLAPTITLEEKEFGIGVKFTPTVLNGGRINLKMVSEVSDLSQTGSPFTTVNNVTAVLPSLTVRRADTTVQLNDGQSFVIAGLIKNNMTETIKRFPGLGEIPVMGALARSTEFQTDQSELLFVITPRLVKPLPEAPRLPTDNHVVPTRAEVYLNGAVESATPPADAPPPQFQQQ